MSSKKLQSTTKKLNFLAQQEAFKNNVGVSLCSLIKILDVKKGLV